MKKLLIYFAFSSLAVVTTTSHALAVVDLTVSCCVNGCHADKNTALFSESNIYPGWSITKRLDVVNNYPEDRSFAMEVLSGDFFDSSPSLSQFLTIAIKKESETAPLYGPVTIATWKNSGYKILSNIPKDGSQIYELTVALGDVDNEYQAKELKFDLNLGFETAPAIPAGYQAPPLHGNYVSTSDVGADNTVVGTTDIGEPLIDAPIILTKVTPNALEGPASPPGEVAGASTTATATSTPSATSDRGSRWWLLLLLPLLLLLLLVVRHLRRRLP